MQLKSQKMRKLAPDRFLQYPHQFFEEKERFGWECKDENVSLS